MYPTPNRVKKIQLLAFALATIVNVYNNNIFLQKDNGSVPQTFRKWGECVKMIYVRKDYVTKEKKQVVQKVHSESCQTSHQTSQKEPFPKTIKSWKPLIYFIRSSLSYIWQGSEYISIVNLILPNLVINLIYKLHYVGTCKVEGYSRSLGNGCCGNCQKLFWKKAAIKSFWKLTDCN